MRMLPAYWTWEKAKERYRGFSSAAMGLPEHVMSEGLLENRTREAFLKGRSALFERLQMAQPRTWNRLMEECAEPLVAQKASYPERSEILSFNRDLPIFIEPFIAVDDHVEWAHYYAALPDFMHAYYSNFNGMHASFTTLSPASLNLPAPVTKWRRLSNYQKEHGLPRKGLANIQRDLGDAAEIFIFVETDWHDLLMVNMNARDGKIYGVPEAALSDYFEVRSAAENLDALFSHVLSGTSQPFFIKQNFT